MAPHLLCVAVTVAALFLSQISAKISVCTFTPIINDVFMNMSLNATAELNNEAVKGTQPNYRVIIDKIVHMGMQVVKNGGAGPAIQIYFSVEMADTKPSPDHVNISLTLKNLDPGNISAATLEIHLGHFIEAFWDIGIPSGSIRVGRSYVGYNASNIISGSSVTIYFMAAPTGKGGVNLPAGVSEISATVYFTYQSSVYGAIIPSVCLKRVTVLDTSILYEQGFTALTFFIMFFIGSALAILGIWLCLHFPQKNRVTVLPATLIKNMWPTGIMTGKSLTKKDTDLVNDFSSIAWHDSILSILALKDKLQIHRKIDNLDIETTINVDTDLEAERIDAAVQASFLLVQHLRYDGHITKATEKKTITNMQNRLKMLEKKQDSDYKEKLNSVLTDAEAKRKAKYDDLLRDHEAKRQKVLNMTKYEPESETKQMLDLIYHQQQQTEQSELTFKLTLEQKEEEEKLRKEFAIHKNMGITEVQQQFIDDIVQMGKLDAVKAEQLMKEHKQLQQKIHCLYDDEISRQRLILEEKLTRRRALALTSETQWDDVTESLNLMASVQLKMIDKMKKNRILSPEQFDHYLNQARTELKKIKDHVDLEKELKQNELIKKLGPVKKKCLDEKIKEHTRALKEYKSKKEQKEKPVDPIFYVDGLVNLISQHRQELSDLEIKIDETQAKELEVMKDQLAENAKQKLKAIEIIFVERLKTKGLQNDVVNKILKTHENEVKELASKQLANRQHQELRLKDELARRRRELEEKRAREKQEQQELREYESEIVQKLLVRQVAVSDAERQRIINEHEKQMVKLENSLTLNKLKQKRLLEEKIAQRRAIQLEELQQKQTAEINKLHKTAQNNGEEDDEETHRKELMLMKKHAEQDIALIQGLNFNIEEELNDVRLEMIKDRALALKEQEERLGALITSLQIEKEKEIAKIEEQQKAIDQLKVGVIDDLIDRGVLTTPKCDWILKNYEQEHEELLHRFDTERAKKEEAFLKKLKERLLQREQSMVQKQDNEIKSLMNAVANTTSARIKRAMLTHKQLVERDKFRNNMEREISQTLEDTRRVFEIEKQKIIQAQEMQFLAGLVKMGNFDRNELVDVLHMLFPGKTEDVITELLKTIYQEDELKQRQGQPRTESTLADRIYKTQYSKPAVQHGHDSITFGTSKHSGPSEQLINKKHEGSLTPRDESIGSRSSFGLLDDVLPLVQIEHPNFIKNSTKKSPTERSDMYMKDRTKRQPTVIDDHQRSSDSDFYTEDEHSLSKNDMYQEDDEEKDYIDKTMGLTHSQTRSNYRGRLNPLRDQDKPAPRKKQFLKKLAHLGGTNV